MCSYAELQEVWLADMSKCGIVKLNDSIDKYLPPGVKTPTYNGQQITLEDLATHTSGLPHDPPNMNLSKWSRFSEVYT